MQSFNLKPQGSTDNSNSNAPKVDFNKINEQVTEDSHTGVISLIVDLGVHTPDRTATTDRNSEFDSQVEAESALEEIKQLLGDKKFNEKGVKISEVGDKFVINACAYNPKPRQEIAVFADLVDNIVNYGGEIGDKPYRALLNKTWKGEVRGLGLSVVPPQGKGGVWTFAPNSMLTELAKVTKQKQITDGSDKAALNNIGLILGKSLMVDMVKNVDGEKVYVNVQGIGTVPNALEKTIDYSLVNPVGVSFDTVTVEILKEAQLRGNIIKKIKSADNYVGSKMEKAIKELESGYSNQEDYSNQGDSNNVGGSSDLDDDSIPF